MKRRTAALILCLLALASSCTWENRLPQKKPRVNAASTPTNRAIRPLPNPGSAPFRIAVILDRWDPWYAAHLEGIQRGLATLGWAEARRGSSAPRTDNEAAFRELLAELNRTTGLVRWEPRWLSLPGTRPLPWEDEVKDAPALILALGEASAIRISTTPPPPQDAPVVILGASNLRAGGLVQADIELGERIHQVGEADPIPHQLAILHRVLPFRKLGVLTLDGPSSPLFEAQMSRIHMVGRSMGFEAEVLKPRDLASADIEALYTLPWEVWPPAVLQALGRVATARGILSFAGNSSRFMDTGFSLGTHEDHLEGSGLWTARIIAALLSGLPPPHPAITDTLPYGANIPVLDRLGITAPLPTLMEAREIVPRPEVQNP